MKRKPDAIVAIVMIFCLCLAVSGFSSMSNDGAKGPHLEVTTRP